MQFEDLSTNSRIAALTMLTRDLGKSRGPAETLATVRRALREVYGPVASMMLSTRGLAEGEFRVLQLQLEEAYAMEDSDLWTANDFPIHRGGPIADIIRNRQPHMIQNADWAADPSFRDALTGYGSILAIPFDGQYLPMNWMFLLRRGPACFTAADLEQAMLRVAAIGSLLESQMLAAAVADAHELVDREVRRVGQIQRALLPSPLPTIPGLELAASFETFGEAGGDLYDFLPLRTSPSQPQRWAIFLADASGHGPSAAVVIAIVQALLHSHPPGVASPAALLEHLNEHLCRRPIETSFVTAFLAVYDPDSRRFTYARAGHPPPLLKAASDQSVKYLDCVGGYPLGIDDRPSYRETTIEFNRGDAILLYTDGIDEARDPAGAMFEMTGIEQALARCTGSPELIVAAVRQAVSQHENGRRATDDQTLVAIGVI